LTAVFQQVFANAKSKKKNLQLTNGLALGWLDVVLPQLRFYNLAFVWAGQTSLNFFSLPSTLLILLGCGTGPDVINASPAPSRGPLCVMQSNTLIT
jgi:hypothetical protein